MEIGQGGKTKSCGCLAPYKIDIVKENVYNHWTILSEVKPYITKEGKMRKVLAKCVCGIEKEILLVSLRTESSKSCGCMIENKTGYYNVSVDSPIPELTLEQMNQRKSHYWKIIELISAKRNENREIIRVVKAECKCGYTKEAILEDVGNSKQCITCAMDEIKSKISEEDRRLRVRLNSVYGGIKTRCGNPESKDYKNYGGRGIKVNESFDTFAKFYEWMILQGYTYDCKLEIDREDNDGDYSVSNCRLLSKAENNRNMRRNIMNWEIVESIRYGEYSRLSDKQVADIVNCSRDTVKSVRNNKTWKEGS